MKNVTVTLEEDVARWARVEAARRGTSVSRLLGDWLKRRMQEQEGYEASMEEYLAGQPAVLKRVGGYPSRAAVHER